MDNHPLSRDGRKYMYLYTARKHLSARCTCAISPTGAKCGSINDQQWKLYVEDGARVVARLSRKETRTNRTVRALIIDLIREGNRERYIYIYIESSSRANVMSFANSRHAISHGRHSRALLLRRSTAFPASAKSGEKLTMGKRVWIKVSG